MGKEKVDYCLNDICEMKKTIVSWLKCELAKGQECANLNEFKELCDGIKDLAEAEKYMKEAEYFCNVNEAMEEAAEEEQKMAGYNSRHFNNGRFAPKGSGHIVHGYSDPMPGRFKPVGPNWNPEGTEMAGYGTMDRIPYDMMYMEDPEGFKETMRKYGYHDGMMGGMGQNGSKYGTAYDKYQHAKRYYHEGDHAQKDKMKAYANEHMSNLMLTAGEMFMDADPELQQKMIKSVEGLLTQWKTTKQ